MSQPSSPSKLDRPSSIRKRLTWIVPTFLVFSIFGIVAAWKLNYPLFGSSSDAAERQQNAGIVITTDTKTATERDHGSSSYEPPRPISVVTCITDDTSYRQAIGMLRSWANSEDGNFFRILFSSLPSYWKRHQLLTGTDRGEFASIMPTPVRLAAFEHRDQESVDDGAQCWANRNVDNKEEAHVFLALPSTIFVFPPLLYIGQAIDQRSSHGNMRGLSSSQAPQATVVLGSAEVSYFGIDDSDSVIIVEDALDDTQEWLLVVETLNRVVANVTFVGEKPVWVRPLVASTLWTRHFLMRHTVDECSNLILLNPQDTNVTQPVPRILCQKMEARLRAEIEYGQRTALGMNDEEVEWAAFDAGVSAGSPNSLSAASAAIEDSHQNYPDSRIFLNIDVVSSKDGVLLAAHDDWDQSPYEAADPDLMALRERFSQLTLEEIMSLRPVSVSCPRSKPPFGTFLDGIDPVHSYNCTGVRYYRMEEFMDTFFANDKHSEPRPFLIVDLKQPTQEMQLQAAQTTWELAQERNLTEDDYAVRFFGDIIGHEMDQVVPRRLIWPALFDQESQKHANLHEIPYLVNAPSAPACKHLITWIWSHHKSDAANANAQGCFIVPNHEAIQSSWDLIWETSIYPNTSKPLPEFHPDAKDYIWQICDVPRLPLDSSQWTRRYEYCVHNGFHAIHYPVPLVSGTTNQNDTEYSRELNFLAERVRNVASSYIISAFERKIRRPDQRQYKSNFAFYFPHLKWEDRVHMYFHGNSQVPNPPTQPFYHASVWRCVSKTLTVMLLLRLQELKAIDLDTPLEWIETEFEQKKNETPELITGFDEDLLDFESTNESEASGFNLSHYSPRTKTRPTEYHPLTLRWIVTNAAGEHGELEGKAFAYKNPMWAHVNRAVEEATNMTFVDAVNHYVVDRMGLEGAFNPNTMYDPFAARGFEGGLDDLLLIGSTLANGGVSPKTHKQIISSASVAEMTTNTVLDYADDFDADKTVKTVRKYLTPYGTGSFLKHKGSWQNETDPLQLVVDGYGMGTWLVPGLRSGMRGGLALGTGETMFYFDQSGFAVAVLAKKLRGFLVTDIFTATIRTVGDFITNAVDEWARSVQPRSP